MSQNITVSPPNDNSACFSAPVMTSTQGSSNYQQVPNQHNSHYLNNSSNSNVNSSNSLVNLGSPHGASGLISPRNSFSSTSAASANHVRELRHRASIASSSPFSGNYTTSTSSTQAQRSPTLPARVMHSTPVNRHSFSDYSFPASPSGTSSYNNEQIIDLMEREQDAIVLKLMREIDALKNENKILKMASSTTSSSLNSSSISVPPQGSTNSNFRRASSLSRSARNSTSSITSINSVPSVISPQPSQAQFVSGTKRNNSCTINSLDKKCKSDVARYEEVVEENRALRREICRLQRDIEQMRWS